MYKQWRIMGLIPARGGSKGIPGKNVRPMAGKPLIAHTIECARSSGVVDRLLCSTDSPEIAGIAEKFGAGAPFLRPPEYSTDTASGMDVIRHAMNWVEKNDPAGPYDLLILLQPTSPLRSPGDILASLRMLEEKKADVVLSACEAGHSPLFMNTLPGDFCMADFIRAEALDVKYRQQLPVFYRLNGAIYLCRWDYLKSHGGFFSSGTYAYVMPRERSVDIDDPIDFDFAEFLIINRAGGGERNGKR